MAITGIDGREAVHSFVEHEHDELSTGIDRMHEVACALPGQPASETLVDVGDFVKAGAVLVRVTGVNAGLRLDEARAAVDRAEANLKLAEAQNTLAQSTAARYAALLATGDVSRTVAEQAKTQAETALQSTNTARASVAEARAPASPSGAIATVTPSSGCPVASSRTTPARIAVSGTAGSGGAGRVNVYW